MPKVHVTIGSLCIMFALVVGMVALREITSVEDGYSTSSSHNEASLIKPATLDSFDKESHSLISTAHLANGLTPPTNKWYSSMVLNDEPRPGFNVPNSVLAHDNGFELGLPIITTASDGIYGPHLNGIQLSVPGAVSYKLTRYDELTITLTYYNNAKQQLFDVTFASGSPYGFVTAKQDVAIDLSSGSAPVESGGLTTFKNGEAWYGALASNGKAGTHFTLQKNDELAIFSAPRQENLATLAAAAKYPIISGEVSYKTQGTKVKTTLSYKTKHNDKTILVHMPHQGKSNSSSALSYPTLYGELFAYKSSKIEYDQPLQNLKWSLSLHNVSRAQRDGLVAQLKTDISNSKLDKNDTYFGGKQLQRLAQLVMVADSLGEGGLRTEALGKLTPALTNWSDSDSTKSFYYDENAKSIVGREASFGSDKELNDHHFHYGYFIYAASVVAKFDKEFLNKYEDKINLLVADIANYKSGEALPLRRNFDAYAGHSWASGTSNYGDGNNQESSSEAVNAWTGAGLWADVSGNDALRDETAWLLANEVATARKYWLSQPNSDVLTAPLISINWGGKREYKTFFSNEPNAKLAVQLLPLNPTMKSYINTLPESIFKGTDISKQYGDYILMAQNDKGSIDAARNYPDTLIDDGNSKAYMMSYILSD